MPTLKDVDPRQAHGLLSQNAILVDVRESYEQAAERIAGAIELPLSRLARGEPVNLPEGKVAVFLCASGARTRMNSAALAEIAGGDAYCLAGGIAAWKRAGFPTERGR